MSVEKKVKVMVVDDEEGIRFFLKLLLSQEGLSVVTAENGYKAIELAKKDKFDLVFLDIRMPGINGVETLRAIREISPETEYIMMSGYAVDDLMREAQKEGAILMLEKPFEFAPLAKFIKDYVAEYYAGSPIRGENIKILVVDDDKNELDFFRKLLAGYTVVTVYSAKEALEAIGKQHFDIVFLDIMLSDTNGTELYDKILKISPKTKVTFITGYYEKYKDDLKRLDIKCYLTKPITENSVLSEIERIKASSAPPQKS
ncbi:MAG: response regulator [Candidatus Omnitrophica bacterium]|nr:response regulator [Candidatus Omnitrophota bacterium]